MEKNPYVIRAQNGYLEVQNSTHSQGLWKGRPPSGRQKPISNRFDQIRTSCNAVREKEKISIFVCDRWHNR